MADILNILPPLKESGDTENLSRAIIALIDLAQRAPIMFKSLFHSLVQFTITVIQDKELDDQARQNALELMATFADYAPSMCKKDPSYAQDMVTQCLSLMTDVGVDDDDASAWNESQDVRIIVHQCRGLLIRSNRSTTTATITMLLESSASTGLPKNSVEKSSSLPHSAGFHAWLAQPHGEIAMRL